jgi:hypothetical protein
MGLSGWGSAKDVILKGLVHVSKRPIGSGEEKRRGAPHPRCFLQEWQTKGLCLTRRVRVAATKLKAVLFSVDCGASARVAEKGLAKEPERNNAETPRQGRGKLRAKWFRRKVWTARTAWRLANTTHVTTYANTLSSVYLNAIRITCGNLRKRQRPHTQTRRMGHPATLPFSPTPFRIAVARTVPPTGALLRMSIVL